MDRFSPEMPDRRRAMRWIMASFYMIAGILHVAVPGKFLPIVPDWVPLPMEVILFTGFCEIAGSIALVTTRWRGLAGVMLALYAVCVFPANIKHAIDGLPLMPETWWYHGPRLAFQPVLVWWALFCSHIIDWPFSSRGRDVATQRRFILKDQEPPPPPFVGF